MAPGVAPILSSAQLSYCNFSACTIYIYIFFHIVAEGSAHLNGVGVMGWACTLEVSGGMPCPNLRLLFHEALFFTYLRSFFVFFIDVLIDVN